MLRSMLYAVIEIECICCRLNNTSHSLVGVYDTFNEAHQLQKNLSELNASQKGLIYPHTQVVVVEIPEVNGRVANIVYESSIITMNQETVKRKQKSRKKKTESEDCDGK